MIISFDIDNTLIPYSNEFEVVYPNKFYRLIGAEPIRKGTYELFEFLVENNHEIWIYTTSFRSIIHLKITFWSHGLYPIKFINEHINRKVSKKHRSKATKNPLLFGIDLHIDDSQGVGKEGELYGFNTLIISPSDENWIESVKTYLLNM